MSIAKGEAVQRAKEARSTKSCNVSDCDFAHSHQRKKREGESKSWKLKSKKSSKKSIKKRRKHVI